MPTSRKLRLDVQNLQVDTFDAVGSGGAVRGTVLGRGETQVAGCYTFEYGCDYTVANTCWQSCPNTCMNPTCPGVGACEPPPATEEATCAETCYWVGGYPYYDGVC